MPEVNASNAGRPATGLPRAIAIPLAALLFLIFLVLLFPWDSLGRRIAWEISRVSGARVDVPNLAPALTARGPVLRARDVTIEHPAVDRVRLSELEIAPRFSTSWLSGDPTLRIWARTGLGHVDGVLRLGGEPAYRGRVSEVEIERLPLRLDATDVRLAGRIEADADVALDPNGTLQGRVDFESANLMIQSAQLPLAIAFSAARGGIEILENGATRIDSVELEGDVVEGELSGEIGLVHRSQSPPLDMTGRLVIHDPTLRQLAPGAGLLLSAGGEAEIRVSGTVDAPRITTVGRASQR